ncbi:hypothetical protein K435DRAFT_912696 [Dendrothele bispora CBS 962.96]|uniref:Uncharacterized protein n=1 Tax=Dendrothele bispora (strain CBS 962.96) TaxID=1314807 RepID=A0A4S8LM70_DENBC|nr:hypothetical protein K435DRAFT_912696 [Dendrothele bispora CBS 962.96]
MAPRNLLKYVPGVRSGSSSQTSFSSSPSIGTTPPATTSTTINPQQLLNLQHLYESRLLLFLNPNELSGAPSYTKLERVFPNFPKTLVWKLWTLVDHLYHPSNWSAFQIVYPYDAVNAESPNLRCRISPSSSSSSSSRSLRRVEGGGKGNAHAMAGRPMPPAITIQTIKNACLVASFTQLDDLLDKISAWAEEAAKRLLVGGSEWDGKSDSKAFWEDLQRNGSGQGSRYHDEGPYGEPEVTLTRARDQTRSMVDITASLRVVNI